MALTSENQAIFALAVEKLQTTGTKAMDHASHSQVQSSKKNGANPVIEWAVDYLNCLPDDKTYRELITRAHMPHPVKPEPWTDREIKQCGGACRGFYKRLQVRGLYGRGVRYLEFMNGGA